MAYPVLEARCVTLPKRYPDQFLFGCSLQLRAETGPLVRVEAPRGPSTAAGRTAPGCHGAPRPRPTASLRSAASTAPASRYQRPTHDGAHFPSPRTRGRPNSYMELGRRSASSSAEFARRAAAGHAAAQSSRARVRCAQSKNGDVSTAGVRVPRRRGARRSGRSRDVLGAACVVNRSTRLSQGGDHGPVSARSRRLHPKNRARVSLRPGPAASLEHGTGHHGSALAQPRPTGSERMPRATPPAYSPTTPFAPPYACTPNPAGMFTRASLPSAWRKR